MNRRQYLAGMSAVVSSLVAGCNAFAGDSSTPTESQSPNPGQSQLPLLDQSQSPDPSQYVHYYTLYNYTDSVQTVQLEIINENGENIIEKEYEMSPDSGQEHVPLPEVPVRAEVRINDRPEEEFVWPDVEPCREKNKAGKPGLQVKIRSDDITYEWPCESVAPAQE